MSELRRVIVKCVSLVKEVWVAQALLLLLQGLARAGLVVVDE